MCMFVCMYLFVCMYVYACYIYHVCSLYHVCLLVYYEAATSYYETAMSAGLLFVFCNNIIIKNLLMFLIFIVYLWP